MGEEDSVGTFDLTFTGIVDVKCSLDPSEYANMELPAITDAVMEVLRGINKDASFDKGEVGLAAEQLFNANNGGYVPTEH